VVKKGERRANPFKERKKFNSTEFVDGAVSSSLPVFDMGSGEEEEEKASEKQTEEMDA
jgi:tRNA pseudouridine38-40 synthase